MQNELADEFYREQAAARNKEVSDLSTMERPGDKILKDLPSDVVKYILQYHKGSPNDMQTTKEKLKDLNTQFLTIGPGRSHNGVSYVQHATWTPMPNGTLDGVLHQRQIDTDKVRGATYQNLKLYPYEY